MGIGDPISRVVDCGGGGGGGGGGRASSVRGGGGGGGGVGWRNGWRTPDGKFASPQGSQRSGEVAEDLVALHINNKPGWQVEGRQVTVRSATGIVRRYDIVARSPSGRFVGVEVKSGYGRMTPYQRNFDRTLNASRTNTATGVGAYAHLTVQRAMQIRINLQ
jgi:hypothetical protein